MAYMGNKQVIQAIRAKNHYTPLEIATEEEMTAILQTASVGEFYRYTGESGIYENGAVYIVEEAEEAEEGE